MKVKDLISMDIDIDVYDDVCEELAIAFCGPLILTDEGQQRFGEVLDYEITLMNGAEHSLPYIIVNVDDPDESVWKPRLKKAKEFFNAAAGYCSDSDFKKWFREES